MTRSLRGIFTQLRLGHQGFDFLINYLCIFLHPDVALGTGVGIVFGIVAPRLSFPSDSPLDA